MAERLRVAPRRKAHYSSSSASKWLPASLEILGDFTDEALEGKLADKKLGGLLVSADFTESDGTWAVTVGFLHAASGRGGFTGSLGGELLTGGFASGGFTCGLLGTGHGMCFGL